MPHLSRILIAAGAILIIAGIVFWLAGDRLHWLGRLPGDIRIERESFRFYFPITTMILLSILLSAVVWIVRKLF